MIRASLYVAGLNPLSVLLLGAALILLASPLAVNAQVVSAVPSVAPQLLSQSLDELADQPATHTGFVLDRSMLQAARAMLQTDGQDGDQSAKRAAASISSIAFDNYRYPHPANYIPQNMAAIKAAYQAAGWKHLVNAHEPVGQGAARVSGIKTDLWLHYTGTNIDGVTVLTRGSRDMNVIQMVCDIRPIDLLHLGGHFGLPKIDSHAIDPAPSDPNAVMVPAPDER